MTQRFGNIKEQFKQPRLELGQKSKLFLLVLISIGLSGLASFLGLVNILYTRQITRKEFPTLVQTDSGDTIKIGFESPDYRSPETIKSFVADTLYYLMTMTSYGAGSSEVSSLNPNRAKAKPIKVSVNGNQGAITQTAWLASEALESKFADTFRSKLAEMTPPDVFTGAEEIILKIDYIEDPIQIKDDKDRWLGAWTVNVIANLKVYRTQKGEVKTIPFNKKVTIRPIDPPPVHSIEEFGELAIALNASQRSGLQITDITDLRLTE